MKTILIISILVLSSCARAFMNFDTDDPNYRQVDKREQQVHSHIKVFVPDKPTNTTQSGNKQSTSDIEGDPDADDYWGIPSYSELPNFSKGHDLGEAPPGNLEESDDENSSSDLKDDNQHLTE
jgi:hypothetical protein